MNTMSASPVEGRPVLVWDAPLRVFHWLLAASFAGAWLTAESERWALVHVTLGYTVAALVAFRVVWGFIGPKHARFSSFVRGPSAIGRYLRSLVSPRPEHHVGHNPAGALAVVIMLALGALTTATGILNDQQWGPWGGDVWEELHEALASGMLAVVIVHILAVVASSVLHRENLVRAMITGRKLGTPADALRRTWAGVAAVMLASVLAFWWMQWDAAPASLVQGNDVHATAHPDEDDD